MKKAFGKLDSIGQHIECRNWDVMLNLHKTLLRACLEDSVRFWLSSYMNDVIKLERV